MEHSVVNIGDKLVRPQRRASRERKKMLNLFEGSPGDSPANDKRKKSEVGPGMSRVEVYIDRGNIDILGTTWAVEPLKRR